MASLYYCVKENNDCPKRDNCKRYIESENEEKTTLFKMACTDANNYVLFIKHENENTKESDT